MRFAGIRFRIARGLGLARRALLSLRLRGWRGTLDRVRAQLRIAPPRLRTPLRLPDPGIAPALPPCTDPQVSIVIPVYGQWPHTRRCLQALAQWPAQAACEVILVDDASPDGTLAQARAVPGLQVVARERNGGFIAACNDGAAVARAPMLLFLNNDTVPQPGWLDALLATFERHPDAGLVGARLVYPDGRLQEAGGIVYRDGSAGNRGRFADPDDPRFGFLRDTDYVSAACALLPTPLFRAIGGFDARYSPAYYEDTALAFAVRAAGRRVLYQPAACVIHDEGITAGTDPGHGIKAHQHRNREVFAAQWSHALQRQPVPGREPPFHAGTGTPQVLYLDDAVPRPDHDSGSLRLVRMLALMGDAGAHVAFVPADLRHAGAYTDALCAAGIETWSEPWARSLPAWLRTHAARFDVIVVARHALAANVLPLLRAFAPRARLVLDTVDLHFLREERAARTQQDAVLAERAAATRAAELQTMAGYDRVVVVSADEADLLARLAPALKVDVISNLHRVTPAVTPFDARRDIVFVGGFRHPPNVDAVRWFVQAVFPRVRAALDAVVFHCIGADVPPEILALGAEDGVRVHGHVPDILPFMDGCRVAVAPLRFGAGVKGKVNLSMAHGQPVVCTALAAEGMHLRDGEDALVADAADAFADAVVRLYRDRALWERISANARENVRRHFSAEAAADAIARLLQPDP